MIRLRVRAVFHRGDQPRLVRGILDPGAAVSPSFLVKNSNLSLPTLRVTVLSSVVVARNDLRFRLRLAGGAIGDQEIDRIALGLLRVARHGLGQRIAGLVVRRCLP